MCGGCCGERSLDGDAIRARRPNDGDAVCIRRSRRTSRRTQACWRGGGGWHGRRYGYDVGLLGAAGMVADKPARWRLAAWRVGGGCWGEERRGGGGGRGRVLCLTREESVAAARHSRRRVWRYVGRNGSAEVRAFVSTGRFSSSSSMRAGLGLWSLRSLQPSHSPCPLSRPEACACWSKVWPLLSACISTRRISNRSLS